MGVGVQHLAVASVLGMSEKPSTISANYTNVKSFPGGLRDFYSYWGLDPGEGRERLLSMSFQLLLSIDR